MKESPVILQSPEDRGQILNRIEIQSKDDKNEEWLQRLIFKHPYLLPVGEFDDSYLPLIPVGREIETKSGYIDNLYVSPVGCITIVETKLWKNPEKHRTVLAQIIDYAKEVSQWGYEELNEAILRTARHEPTSEKKTLEKIISPHLNEAGIDLIDFQERIISCLNSGEFLLLIVGDKISANVALLTESIQGTPGLDFRLGLVELQLYSMNPDKDWPLIVIPDIVGRTVEQTRGVIKIQYIQEKPSVSIEVSEEDKLPPAKGKTTPEIFLQKAPSDLSSVYEHWFEIWAKKPLYIYWGTTGFSLRLKIKDKLETVLDAYPEWAVSLIRRSDAERLSATNENYQKYFQTINSVPNAINILTADKKYIKYDNLTAEHLNTLLDATTSFAEGLINTHTKEKG